LEVVVVLLLVLLGLVIGAAGVMQLRESSRQQTTQHRLQQLGQGLQVYHDLWRSFPAAGPSAGP
jgi:type II secretory pathway pseudopilin PulG